eukprot:1159086-Pelagomonas_calceolata.AAC.3
MALKAAAQTQLAQTTRVQSTLRAPVVRPTLLLRSLHLAIAIGPWGPRTSPSCLRSDLIPWTPMPCFIAACLGACTPCPPLIASPSNMAWDSRTDVAARRAVLVRAEEKKAEAPQAEAPKVEAKAPSPPTPSSSGSDDEMTKKVEELFAKAQDCSSMLRKGLN